MQWIVVSSFMFFTVLFLALPEVDISISRAFFHQNQFFAQNNFLIGILSNFIEFGGIALWIIFVGYFGIKELKINGLRNFFSIGIKRKLMYISSVGFLGSVGLINIIKWNIMRCRPIYVDDFGGPAPFTKVWTFNLSPLAQHSNCLSFVSGHAAIGFLLFSLAFLYPKTDSRRKKYILLGMFTGGLFGFIRIIQGQHFISDVIFSGYVVYFSALILSYLLHPHK